MKHPNEPSLFALKTIRFNLVPGIDDAKIDAIDKQIVRRELDEMVKQEAE